MVSPLAKRISNELSIEEALEYDPITGNLYWKFTKWRVVKGQLAGCLHKKTGYIRIVLGRKSYLAHRVAFYLMTGRWPDDQLDHINRIKADNRWDNLREATHSENMMNRGLFNLHNRSDNKLCQ